MHLKQNLVLGIAGTFLLSGTVSSFAAKNRILIGHVPKITANLSPTSALPSTNELHLAIGLALHDEQGLNDLLTQLYDPSSTNFHRFITPDEFTQRFGPTEGDYQAVKDFARTNGLAIRGAHKNRLLLDIGGQVSSVENAFHVKMLRYRHPLEARDFFAPDTEPSVDARLPISDISGLNNYALPRPRLHKVDPAAAAASARSGSGSGGTYIGNDFRAAYLPDVALTGSGQMVGLVAFDGFYAKDITAYQTKAGLAGVPVQTVLIDGFSGTPTTGSQSGNEEVALDIEMATAMAPGLSKIIVFEADPNGIPNDILNRMAASNQVKQLSCSWGWGGGPTTTTDNIFKQMAAQGQSFFCASGASDAFTNGANSVNGVDNTSLVNTPSSSPYITVVGGTTLSTTGPGGAWTSEKVWNWGKHNESYVGSGGGISSHYSIPSWQSSVDMSANGGSASQRNIPDVALIADNVYAAFDNGSGGALGGTSCAAPLWAGLAALINQQAAAAGKPSVGFLNPAIYTIGTSSSYSANFHDTTTGDNTSADSPNAFYAATGYDLCTGWGTPAGQALIDSLSGVHVNFYVTPQTGFTAEGPVGGPFSQGSTVLQLTNSSNSAVNWSLVNTSAWLEVSATNGTLTAGSGDSLTAGLTPAASQMPAGDYTTSLRFTNSAGDQSTVTFALSIGQSIVENGGFETGDFSGWTLAGNTTISRNIYNAVESASSGFSVVHSGNYGAFLGDSQLASLSQTLATIPGQYYLISLWLDNPDSGSGQQFSLNWNGSGSAPTTPFNFPSPQPFSWTNLQVLVSATSTNTTLEIQAQNPTSYFGLDDVSVVPVRTPAVQLVLQTAGALQLTWPTAPRLTYQLEYTTDLAQGNWLPFGDPFVATNSSSSLQDTNAFSSGASQRFYRLKVAP
jgi:subtilase family serine protease